ncbi:MAG TPA: GNAT family N-acetyltransferase [Jiangellaceae bacterium]
MQLTWLDPEHLDDRDVAGAVALHEAARLVDSPHQLVGPTLFSYGTFLRQGWDGNPPIAALAQDDKGRVVGVLQVMFPRWDNTHLGSVEVTVDPLARRQGIGRKLFEAGVDRVRSKGRRLVLADCWADSPGVAFAEAMGLERAAVGVQRRQDLHVLDWPRLDAEYAAAESRASGYELVRLAGPTPEDMLPDVATMVAAINDAPFDDLDIEDEVFTPERVRKFETAQLAAKMRIYRVMARERETGSLGGHTMVGVDAEHPGYASQYDTSVLRAHRGHRLGRFLKIAMLQWLADEEPQLRMLDTWNAASNAHMIEVNEVLGYQVVATGIEWQLHL